jgi:hypothetical protein
MNEKYVLSLSLELVKVVGYDFPHLFDNPSESHLFFKWPLVDTEFDISNLSYEAIFACDVCIENEVNFNQVYYSTLRKICNICSVTFLYSEK